MHKCCYRRFLTSMTSTTSVATRAGMPKLAACRFNLKYHFQSETPFHLVLTQVPVNPAGHRAFRPVATGLLLASL